MDFSKPYRPRPEAVAIRASATRIAELAVSADGLILAHRRKLLDVAVWKMTEADGKYNLRYRSKAVLALPPTATYGHVVHEHVTPRSVLIDAMLAQPHQASLVLSGAIACLVTKEEHARLHKTAAGWERYRVPGIEIIDMSDGNAARDPQLA